MRIVKKKVSAVILCADTYCVQGLGMAFRLWAGGEFQTHVTVPN